MGETYELVIHGGQCVTPSGIQRVDVGVREGRIVALGSIRKEQGARHIDATGLHVLPGAIDSQVHFREPGLEHKEDLATGTASGALGGITAVFEMPNTKPNTDSFAAMADKVERTRGRVWTDISFFMGATPENAHRLAELENEPGCCGVKVFMGSSTGSLLIDDVGVLERALTSGHRRIAVHCEDEARLRERRPMLDRPDAHVGEHHKWRDAETALLATQTLIRLARKARRPVHVLHVTTAAEIAFLATCKDIATFEITPQHLTLHAPDCYDRLGTFAQMNPPIREKHHQDALWWAIENGVADVLGSDHAPHTREEKARDYPKSPSGMPGVQTMLPLMLDHVNSGRLTLMRLVDLLCHGPARLYGLTDRGRLAPGFRGDFTLVDLKAKRTITHADQASRVGWTPFDGHQVTGWPIATIINGETVMQDGALIGSPSGQPIVFPNSFSEPSLEPQ